jgi:hypothetical protein
VTAWAELTVIAQITKLHFLSSFISYWYPNKQAGAC